MKLSWIVAHLVRAIKGLFLRQALGQPLEPEFKKKWVDALQSNKYSQTHGILKDNIGFCCLGVAEDIMLSKTGNTWIDVSTGFRISDTKNDQAHRCEPSETLIKAVGLTFPCGAIPFDLQEDVRQYVNREMRRQSFNWKDLQIGEISTLAGLNDRMVTFEVIAKVIDKFL